MCQNDTGFPASTNPNPTTMSNIFRILADFKKEEKKAKREKKRNLYGLFY